MNTRTRTVLAVALGTVLIAPLAAAQSDTAQSRANARAGLQQAVEPQQALPPQVNPAEVVEQSVDPRVPTGDIADDAINAAPPPPPLQSRGATPAAGHADVVQRDVWSRLDVDGDGRISVEEGRVDADFGANFEMIDGDGDGFVTDAEFRANARLDDDADDMDDADDDRDVDRDDHTDPVEPDPMDDRDGMDDDGTGMDDADGE